MFLGSLSWSELVRYSKLVGPEQPLLGVMRVVVRRGSLLSRHAAMPGCGQHVVVIDVFHTRHRADDDVCGFGRHDGGFSHELLFIVLLGLAHAQDIRFMQAVDLVYIRSPLTMNSSKTLKRLPVSGHGFALVVWCITTPG